MPTIDTYLLIASSLLLLSILASKTSGYLGIPSLLLFLAIGMLAGSEGPGGIYFDDPLLTQYLGVVALTLILFYGGLDTRWESIAPVLGKGLLLSTLGVLITAVLTGWFSSHLLGISLLEGMLLGAIVSSTDAAAVFSVLRSRNISLKGDLRPLLELESGSNDPMAVFLTTGLIGLAADPTQSIGSLLPSFALQMTLGTVFGYGLGKGAVYLINRIRLDYDGLYPVVTLAYVFLAYSATALAGGNGFLAVYIAGIVMGNGTFIHKRSVIRFHDGMAWLMQIGMFLTLGLLVFPSHLVPILGSGILVAGFLMLVARPVSVAAALFFTQMTWREIAMISWVGLRGAVPIILALFPLIAGIPQAEIFFNLVFFIVILSVVFQGTTIQWAARRLKVDAPLPVRMKSSLEFETSGKETNELVEFLIHENSPVRGKRILELRLPKGVLIVLIQREEEFVVPMGGTVLEKGDLVLVLLDREKRESIQAILDANPPSPEEAPSQPAGTEITDIPR